MAVFLNEKTVTVTTAGTPVQVDSSLKVATVTITAGPNNNGTIYIGSSSINPSNKIGIPLAANESLELQPPVQLGKDEVIDLSKLYVDSTASSDEALISWYVRDGGHA